MMTTICLILERARARDGEVGVAGTVIFFAGAGTRLDIEVGVSEELNRTGFEQLINKEVTSKKANKDRIFITIFLFNYDRFIICLREQIYPHYFLTLFPESRKSAQNSADDHTGS
jgi:hypothetical protein